MPGLAPHDSAAWTAKIRARISLTLGGMFCFLGAKVGDACAENFSCCQGHTGSSISACTHSMCHVDEDDYNYPVLHQTSSHIQAQYPSSLCHYVQNHQLPTAAVAPNSFVFSWMHLLEQTSVEKVGRWPVHPGSLAYGLQVLSME